MNSEIKAKWVAALRHGKYEQGRGWLNRDGKMCCLGVLCELAVAEGVIPEGVAFRSPFGDIDVEVVTYGDGCTRFPPTDVMRWAGLNERDVAVAMVDNVYPHGSLAEVNDSGEYTFKQIADIIEKEL